MLFEWDEQKNRTNIRKHDFDFADAWEVFEEPMLHSLDEREDYGEDRWIGIGILHGGIVALVYSEPDEDTIRVIHSGGQHPMNAPNTKNTSETNWEHIDQMKDADIDFSDIPPLDDSFFARAKIRMPKERVAVTLNLDEDVVEWFKRRHDNYERLMNAALRIYMAAHRTL